MSKLDQCFYCTNLICHINIGGPYYGVSLILSCNSVRGAPRCHSRAPLVRPLPAIEAPWGIGIIWPSLSSHWLALSHVLSHPSRCLLRVPPRRSSCFPSRPRSRPSSVLSLPLPGPWILPSFSPSWRRFLLHSPPRIIPSSTISRYLKRSLGFS